MDETILERFMGQLAVDIGAATSAVLVRIGHRTGLYRAMAGAGPLTSTALAERAGCAERYVREWLANQAAGGYVLHHAPDDTYELPEEHALALVDETSPVYLMGGFDVLEAMHADEPTIINAFRSGKGVGWHEHHPCMAGAVASFLGAGYRANLLSTWLPALDGVVDKLQAGAHVADVACGFGVTTILMAQAFPSSTFVGFDGHDVSIAQARKAAAEAGVTDRVTFEVATAKEYPGTAYDLVCTFDALHDMGDPLGAAAHVRSTLARDGAWLLVEPFAGDRVADNLNPVGRLFYAGSTLLCTPGSLAQEVGLALGAQAGEARLRTVINDAGFTSVRRAAESPFNLVLEARP